MEKHPFKKYFLTFWLIFTILNIFLFTQQAKAINPNLEISYPGQPGPLFSESNFYPLKSVEKQVLVTNKSEIDQTFAFRISSIIGDTPLADVLILQVKNGGAVLLEDTLAHLKSDDEAVIDTIPAQSTSQFNFIVYMQNVGNEYQALTIETADFVLGFSSKGQVLGDKDEISEGGKVLGATTKLAQTGDGLSLTLLYSFIITSLILIFEDKKKRKQLVKVWFDFIKDI